MTQAISICGICKALWYGIYAQFSLLCFFQSFIMFRQLFTLPAPTPAPRDQEGLHRIEPHR